MNLPPIDSIELAACKDTLEESNRCYHAQFARAEGLQRHLNEIKTILQSACDRDWKDETLLQTANIASNALYWRNREINRLRKALGMPPYFPDDKPVIDGTKAT